MTKIDTLLPAYYGVNLATTVHKQMGFSPVIVHGGEKRLSTKICQICLLTPTGPKDKIDACLAVDKKVH